MLTAFKLAVCAWVITNILMDEGMILYFWRRFITPLPQWLYKPLGGCDYCFGGQVALWYALFTLGPTDGLFCVLFTIFVIKIINTIVWK